jgi:hypothetical protein
MSIVDPSFEYNGPSELAGTLFIWSLQARFVLIRDVGAEFLRRLYRSHVRLARLHGSVAAVAILTRPARGRPFPPTRPTDCLTIVYPGRALFPGGDGEHCSTFRSDEVQDGRSCGAKHRQSHAFNLAEAGRDMGVVPLK